MERRVGWSISLTGNVYYWWSYGNLGKESMNQIPPLKNCYILAGSKGREKMYDQNNTFLPLPSTKW
jgi:hypothetical protein